ncbi:MAG: hypothetical protein SP1CHLAM54_17270 [Chlamydiia bacterium]|nr:hypothetical protein [Chlamydiia bacterium]MCH9616615.1 hypothetical protein [Chlamydiia bacterium]MCH9629345.1 hypothetical protein [Chlamydiia bacterium]
MSIGPTGPGGANYQPMDPLGDEPIPKNAKSVLTQIIPNVEGLINHPPTYEPQAAAMALGEMYQQVIALGKGQNAAFNQELEPVASNLKNALDNCEKTVTIREGGAPPVNIQEFNPQCIPQLQAAVAGAKSALAWINSNT